MTSYHLFDMECLMENSEEDCEALLTKDDKKADDFMEEEIKKAGGGDKVNWDQLKGFVDQAGYNPKFKECIDKAIANAKVKCPTANETK